MCITLLQLDLWFVVETGQSMRLSLPRGCKPLIPVSFCGVQGNRTTDERAAPARSLAEF